MMNGTSKRMLAWMTHKTNNITMKRRKFIKGFALAGLSFLTPIDNIEFSDFDYKPKIYRATDVVISLTDTHGNTHEIIPTVEPIEFEYKPLTDDELKQIPKHKTTKDGVEYL
jgi:hypothetical protein